MFSFHIVSLFSHFSIQSAEINPKNSANFHSWKDASSSHQALVREVRSATRKIRFHPVSLKSVFYLFCVASFSIRLSPLCQSHGCAAAPYTLWYSCIFCMSNQHNWTTKYLLSQRELTKRVVREKGKFWRNMIRWIYFAGKHLTGLRPFTLQILFVDQKTRNTYHWRHAPTPANVNVIPICLRRRRRWRSNVRVGQKWMPRVYYKLSFDAQTFN